MKRFKVKIPRTKKIDAQTRLNQSLPFYADLNLPELPDINIDIEPPSLAFRYPRDYYIVPTKRMYDALGNSRPIHYKYVQHRQMDEGRAIALGRHPRKLLLFRGGDIWKFGCYTLGGIKNPSKYKEYYVRWSGYMFSGLPPIGVSGTTFGQYAPDSLTWAVYFLRMGIPSDELWFPVPSKNPTWNNRNIGYPVPEYNLNLRQLYQ